MKLAEALSRRQELNQLISSQVSHMSENVTYNEDEEQTNTFVFPVAVAELERLHQELRTLIVAINVTNVQTILPSGYSIMETIAQRDSFKALAASYASLKTSTRYAYNRRTSHDELKFFNNFTSKDVDDLAQRASEQYRKLDLELQEANWTTELITQ